MTKDMEILCAGEEVLMRVRYVSPLGGLTLQMDGLPCRLFLYEPEPILQHDDDDSIFEQQQ